MAMTADPNAPPSGPDLVAKKVGVLFGRSLGLGTEKRLDLLRTTAAHRSFLCNLEQATGDVLTGARFTGWRYLVLHGEEALVEAEVDEDPASGRWRVVSAAAESTLAQEFRDLTWLAGRPEVKSGDFEICYLRVPSGVARAWWLRDTTGDRDKDLLLPVQPSSSDLRGPEPELLRAARFRAAVADIARRKLEYGKVLLRGVPQMESV